MYYPYFRGKQFELITIRETATLMAESHFVPIVEPVKEALGGLDRALKAVCDANGGAIVIVNPFHGEHSNNGAEISTLLQDGYAKNAAVEVGILLRDGMSIQQTVECCSQHNNHPLTLVHAGFTQAKALSAALVEAHISCRNVFFEDYCGKLYRKHFSSGNRILLRDGFQRRRNKDHPPVEAFSDLHATYEEEGMTGFGDFLIVGDDFSESGGPAYAVAIHLTFIDSDQDDAMFIHHFVSTSQDTPTDPAGKFAEALEKLVAELDSGNSKIIETSAVQEFRALHNAGHFPGLGSVKKLSMKHHIETLAEYFS
ncbi:MAG: sce7725 family protein [Planctomycetota bacterium]|nr:sce7725 family protein [Planctomycetota bacterium]